MRTEVTETISADADAIWATIAKGSDVHHWFGSVIVACSLDGTDRACTMADGAELKERILEVDSDARRFRYAIDEHPLPATNVIATITVNVPAEGKTTITWGADYDAAPEHAGLMRETLTGLYAQAIKSLEAFHAKVA